VDSGSGGWKPRARLVVSAALRGWSAVRGAASAVAVGAVGSTKRFSSAEEVAFQHCGGGVIAFHPALTLALAIEAIMVQPGAQHIGAPVLAVHGTAASKGTVPKKSTRTSATSLKKRFMFPIMILTMNPTPHL
jgi:hypothetical protein